MKLIGTHLDTVIFDFSFSFYTLTRDVSFLFQPMCDLTVHPPLSPPMGHRLSLNGPSFLKYDLTSVGKENETFFYKGV